MKISFLTFGKLRGPGTRTLADHYLKLLGKWPHGAVPIQIEEIELKPSPLPDKSQTQFQKAQAEESQIVLKALDGLSPSRHLILLDEAGKAQRTQDWASHIRALADRGVADLAFVIGSSCGHSTKLKSQADALWSFGPQTLPHELARIVLYEQIFRAVSILNRHPYHHEG